MSVEFWDYKDSETGRSTTSAEELEIALVIRTDNPADSLAVLRRDLPQFQKWQPHPTETGLFVEDFQATKIEYSDPAWWDATVKYTSNLRENPLAERVKITVRTETVPGATITDMDGNIIRNTAGEIATPFDRPRRVRVFTFTKNLARPADWLFDYEDVLNSSTVRIYSQSCRPRTLLLHSVGIGDRQELNGIAYYVHTVELRYLKDGWDIPWPNRGWSELVEEREDRAATSGPRILARKKIYLPGGAEPTQPVFLDADGRALFNPTPEEIITNTAKLLPEADLNRLPLR